jgi:hypothetical protein
MSKKTAIEATEAVAAGENESAARRALSRSADQVRVALLKFVRDGAGPVTGSAGYAADRLERTGDADAAIRRIVRESQLSTATSGFVTGLGGFVTMPVTIPAAFAGAALLNARMVGAICHLRGYDVEDPFVQQMMLVTVAGGSANVVLREAGVNIGRRAAVAAIEHLSIDTVRAINKKVGFMLLAKYGTQRSAITLAKAVPFVGGLVGGTVDASFTRAVAAAAKKTFPLLEGSTD